MILIGSQQQLVSEMERMAAFVTDRSGATGYELWDDIRTSPERIFFITSPTGDPRFDGYVPVCAEIVMPEDWLTCSDCNPVPEEEPQAYNL